MFHSLCNYSYSSGPPGWELPPISSNDPEEELATLPPSTGGTLKHALSLIFKHLDRAANLAIIVGVAVFIVIAARGGIFHKSAAPKLPGPTSLVGTTVSLPGVQFPQNQDTLLIVVSTQCHFCQDSLPFYQKPIPEIKNKVNVIAVLPQSRHEAEEWLDKSGITGTQTASANPGSMGVSGTPTLLQVDSSGRVKAAWPGRLDESAQQQVAKTLLQ